MATDPESLKKFLDDSGLSFKSGSFSYILDCPRCGKKDKLYIRKSDGRFVCWVCKETENFQGKAEFVLAELTGSSISDISFALHGVNRNEGSGDRLTGKLKSLYNQPESEDDIIEEPVFAETAYPLNYRPIAHDFCKSGAEYLAGRGINLETAITYDLHFSPIEKRVVFPVKVSGKLIGWQGRLIVDPAPASADENSEKKSFVQPKILSSKSLSGKRDRLLMFQDNLVVGGHAILCEGPVDGIKAHLCGGNVVTMGKAVSKAQIDLLYRYKIKKLYLGLDPDAADEKRRIVKLLADDMEIFDMAPPSKNKKVDLGDLTFKEVLDIYQNAPKADCGYIFGYIKPRG